MNPALKIPGFSRKPPSCLLGIVLDGSHLQIARVKRSDGGLSVVQDFSIALALDPLAAQPDLVGREIRNHLDKANVHERACVVGFSLKSVLTTQTELPQLPEADASSMLQLEAERGFAADISGLQVADSRAALSEGRQFVLFAGIANLQLAAIESALMAARLKPLSFSLAVSALNPPTQEPGTLALLLGEQSASLQVTACGGIVSLRSLDGVVYGENGRQMVNQSLVARELRVTLGQLPGEIRETVSRVCLYGPANLTRLLEPDLTRSLAGLGLRVETPVHYTPTTTGHPGFPDKTPISPAVSLAADALTGRAPALEFLPPKPSALQAIIARYSSGRLGVAGALATASIALVALLFLIQQLILWHKQDQWGKMRSQVLQIQDVEANIQQFRPWYDPSHPTLSVLMELTQAFPEDGSVTAKTLEIRDGSQVNLTGTARDNIALLNMQSRLRMADNVSAVRVDQIRGKAPIQFSFDFIYAKDGSHGN